MAQIVKPVSAVRQPGRPSRGRVFFLPLTEGAGRLAWDSAGRNHGAFSASNVGWATGPFGKCLDFTITGTGVGVIDCGSDASIDDLGPMTLAAWVSLRSTGESSIGRIMDKGGAAADGWSFLLQGTIAGWGLSFRRKFTTSTLAAITNNTVGFGSDWKRVLVTWDGTPLRTGVVFYANGSVVGPNISLGNDSTAVIASDAANPLLIGNVDLATLIRGYDGLLDAPSIWNRVVTLDEIRADYHDTWRFVRSRLRVATFAMSAIPSGPIVAAMPFTNYCCRNGGSNLNAGTRTGSTTEPGTAASFTYASGTWVSATGVFTVASGNPFSDGVVVGDFASVYADGASVTTLVGRVTAISSTTITVSLTAKSGTTTDGTSNRTLKIGGAWAGMASSSGFPLSFLATATTNAAGDPVRVNFKNDQTYTISAAITLSTSDVQHIAGYTVAYGDLGRAVIDGGTTGASYVPLTLGGSGARLEALEFRNNGATGLANGLAISAVSELFRVVVRDMRGTGCASTSSTVLTECEFYGCNQSNTSNFAGLTATGSISLLRCVFHDNTGTNTAGARLTGTASQAATSCVFDTNGTGGGLVVGNVNGVFLVSNCDFYNNAGPGLSHTNGKTRAENCNFVKNGTYGAISAGGILSLANCGFGSGTTANTSGTTSGDATESGSVNYAANATPWNAPATGDFRITLAGAKGTGRGSFLQTATSYTGMIAYPDIGAAQHLESAGSSGSVFPIFGSSIIKRVS